MALGNIRRLRNEGLRSAEIVPLDRRRGDGGGSGGGGSGGSAEEPWSPFDPTAHQANAAEVLEKMFSWPADATPMYRTLLWQNGAWVRWTPQDAWQPAEQRVINKAIRACFEGRLITKKAREAKAGKEEGADAKKTSERKDHPPEFHVNNRFVSEVARALEESTGLMTDEKLAPPCYVAPLNHDGAAIQSEWPPPDRFIPVANGLVDYHTLELSDATPAFFSSGASPIAYNPDAECPAWLKFNHQIFEGDPETIEAAQELLGYGLYGRRHLQKIGFIKGPSRSGKSTWVAIAEAVIGAMNVSGPSMSALAGQFGREALIGKKWASFGDSRVPRQDKEIVLEWILKVSGGDTVNIARKFGADWTGRLPTFFVFVSNELPELSDPARAFEKRLILLRTGDTVAKEDTALPGRLIAEAPGILRWGLVGLNRLLKRGHFKQPQRSADEISQLAELSSPIGEFLRECCADKEGKYGGSVPTKDLYTVWLIWSGEQRSKRHFDQAQFGKQLYAAGVPGLKISQPRDPETKARLKEYIGVQLNGIGLALLNEHNKEKAQGKLGV